MSHRIRPALVFAVALASLSVLAHASAESMQERWRRPIEPFHVIGNIDYVGSRRAQASHRREVGGERGRQ
jgi:hypothetical protein